MVKCIAGFLDVCYIACWADITEATLNEFDSALARFHGYWFIFQTTGVHSTGFSLPRQHSLIHYRCHIEEFGAPNGLCSSITESWHITAVKKPWHQSNHYEALGQMLLTNQQLDKLAAAKIDFIGTVLVLVLKNECFVKFFIPILSQVIGTIKYSKLLSFCCCSY